jgi:hypothetical protein
MELQFADIPQGITLGDSVIQIPSIQDVLVTDCEWLFKPYSWVKRGDNLVRFRASYTKPKKGLLKFFLDRITFSGYLKSPVSGLILHSNYSSSSTVESETAGNYLMTILLPDDEPEPEKTNYIYGRWLSDCEDHKNEFIKPRLKEQTDQKVEQIISRQLNYPLKIVGAMPKYKDYLDELKTELPILRPYVKHLSNL